MSENLTSVVSELARIHSSLAGNLAGLRDEMSSLNARVAATRDSAARITEAVSQIQAGLTATLAGLGLAPEPAPAPVTVPVVTNLPAAIAERISAPLPAAPLPEATPEPEIPVATPGHVEETVQVTAPSDNGTARYLHAVMAGDTPEPEEPTDGREVRRQFQARCRELEIPARGSTEELRQRIVEAESRLTPAGHAGN